MRLKLYHQRGSRAFETPADFKAVPIFKWQTCLRSLVLVPDELSHKISIASEAGLEGEWLEGEAAYRRLLEIVCGLHSPLVGETEVFGQFKDAIHERLAVSSDTGSSDVLEAAFAATLRQWAKALIEDVKLVRQKHLLDLGSQSYGSLVRREVRELNRPQIEFLGSGQLVVEILPWLLKAFKVEPSGAPMVVVHARDTERARQRLSVVTSEPIVFSSLDEGPRPSSSQRVLIVAAPMTASEIFAWANDRAIYDLVIDLRGESRHDSLDGGALTKNLRSLDEVFSSIELARDVADRKKSEALKLIDQRVDVRLAAATHRPFGWDDVWS